MTSILVSSDDPEIQHLVGESVAKDLGCRFLDRSFLKEVAARFDVEVERLVQVLDRSSGRITGRSQQLLLTYIQTATLEALLHDSVVCAGLAAHLFVRDVSHVLMVRVLSDAQTRASRLVTQEGISMRKALKMIAKERERHDNWSIENFLLNEGDPAIYDTVISLGQLEVAKVVEIVKEMAGHRKFQPMTYSRKVLHELVLAGRVRLALLPRFPEIRVRADGGTAIVHVKCSRRQKQKIASEMKQITEKIEGLDLLEVHAVSSLRDLDQRQNGAEADGA